jgi:alpha-beta hydrolase superfamily lysophospholipase
MYARDKTWLKLQQHLPAGNRITNEIFPLEKFTSVKGMNIHLDEYRQNSNVSIVILHGVGGNGRLLSFLAVPLYKAGYNVICPDLPGYGFTHYQNDIDYQTWIDVGSYVVEQELKSRHKVFVIGLSAGGMLGYNVCCSQGNVAGLVVTNILDSREQAVRDYSARNKLTARYGLNFFSMLPAFITRAKIPIRMVTRMKGLVNNEDVLKILLEDKRGAGSNVKIDFLLSMMNHSPLIEAEKFDKIPILMAYPGNDMWTPVEISDLFFRKINSEKTRIRIEGAGHFPIEEPGIKKLEAAIVEFVQKHA